MPTFLHSWSPYGPSGRVEAEHLDMACAMVHAALEALGLRITARHLPPLGDTSWQGAVLVVRSQEARYGDNAELRVSVYALGETSYHDSCRKNIEELKARN